MDLCDLDILITETIKSTGVNVPIAKIEVHLSVFDYMKKNINFALSPNCVEIDDNAFLALGVEITKQVDNNKSPELLGGTNVKIENLTLNFYKQKADAENV